MSNAPYTDHYDPLRNPNSAMLRVLANAGYDIRDLSPSMGGSAEDDFWVQVELPRITGKLLREADTAGFSLVHADPVDAETLTALFRTVG